MKGAVRVSINIKIDFVPYIQIIRIYKEFTILKWKTYPPAPMPH